MTGKNVARMALELAAHPKIAGLNFSEHLASGDMISWMRFP